MNEIVFWVLQVVLYGNVNVVWFWNDDAPTSRAMSLCNAFRLTRQPSLDNALSSADDNGLHSRWVPSRYLKIVLLHSRWVPSRYSRIIVHCGRGLLHSVNSAVGLNFWNATEIFYRGVLSYQNILDR